MTPVTVVRTAVKRDGFPEDIRIGAVMFQPEIVADDDRESAGSTASLLVIAGKGAPKRWLDPEDIEEFPR